MDNTLKEQVEKGIKALTENGIESNNLETLGQLVDIHKDLANEEYWKKKMEVMKMRYRNYNGYSEGYGEDSYGNESYGRRRRDSKGRYMEGSYGRRGVPGTGRGRYRGEEAMDEMAYHYGNYSESSGQYGAEGETMKSLEYMLESVVDFIKMLEEEAGSQEEVKLIKHYTKKISEM
jgi:hypothetical protein